jgi:phosphoglycolate phosphatase-like HAD superfamily hydrolase
VVGFDLDMTLIDTRPGFAACLVALAEESGVVFDVEAMTSRLGPPLETMLADYVEDPVFVAELGDRFRALYPDHAVAPTQAFPGAHEALAAVRDQGGETLVVTGKYRPNAALHVQALGLPVDHLVGWLWGVGKAEALVGHGASVYVGDHVYDVEGALAAGALSVSVPSGGCSEDELRAAGTHVVLADLTAFPSWLDAHLRGLARAAG